MTHSRKTENNESSIDCHQRGWKKNSMAEIKFCLLWLNNVCVPALNVGLSISFSGFRDRSITKIKKRKSADATVRALRHKGVFKPENWSRQSIFLCCCNYDRWLRRSSIKTSAAIYMETGTGRLLLSLHSKHLLAFCRKDSSDPFRITHTHKNEITWQYRRRCHLNTLEMFFSSYWIWAFPEFSGHMGWHYAEHIKIKNRWFYNVKEH